MSLVNVVDCCHQAFQSYTNKIIIPKTELKFFCIVCMYLFAKLKDINQLYTLNYTYIGFILLQSPQRKKQRSHCMWMVSMVTY